MTVSMRLFAASCVTLLMNVPAPAQTYPDRPVRLVVGFAPGGGTDVAARQIMPVLSDRLGRQVVIDNRPGGGSTLGTGLVAKAAPDGYTLLMSDTTFGIIPGLYAKLAYDPVRDFAPVTQVSSMPSALVVHPALPVSSVKELVAYAKAKPGALNFGSGGVGTPVHMAGELLQLQAGVKMVHVPYKGAGPAMADLIGGHFQVMFPTVQSVSPYIKSARVRLLAFTADKRSRAYPEVPTMEEAGVPGVVSIAWFGLHAPAGTPRPIVEKLQGEIAKIVQEPVIRDRLLADGAEPVGSTPGQFARFVSAEIAKWSGVVKAAGIKAEF